MVIDRVAQAKRVGEPPTMVMYRQWHTISTDGRLLCPHDGGEVLHTPHVHTPIEAPAYALCPICGEICEFDPPEKLPVAHPKDRYRISNSANVELHIVDCWFAFTAQRIASELFEKEAMFVRLMPRG